MVCGWLNDVGYCHPILATTCHAGSLSMVVWHGTATHRTGISSNFWPRHIHDYTRLHQLLCGFSTPDVFTCIYSHPNSILARIFVEHNETITPFHQAFSRGFSLSAPACIHWYIECVNFLGMLGILGLRIRLGPTKRFMISIWGRLLKVEGLGRLTIARHSPRPPLSLALGPARVKLHFTIWRHNPPASGYTKDNKTRKTRSARKSQSLTYFEHVWTVKKARFANSVSQEKQ